jgi:hypothetical protein
MLLKEKPVTVPVDYDNTPQFLEGYDIWGFKSLFPLACRGIRRLVRTKIDIKALKA